jgi:hypothetical protein
VGEVLLGEEMVIHFVSLCSVQLGEWFGAAYVLGIAVFPVSILDNGSHLEHVLPESLSPPLENNLAEVREVDKPVPGDGVGKVYNLFIAACRSCKSITKSAAVCYF